jgi:exopolyphosphatase/guanosine-5'-triphosphate,3'-diphosphate pyrophosphatase
MQRIAVIDLGTNTFNILIIETLSGTEYKKLYQTKISVKLGEGGINKGFIAPIPFQRGIDAMKVYKKTIEDFAVDTTFAMATSAIRDASNGNEFVQQVKQELGFDIQVISGDKEAELIYIGVRDAVKMNSEKSLIVDIGGGSTEFIIANNNEIFWKQSFKLGAARLLERTNPSDPITQDEINGLINYLNIELSPLIEAVKKFPVSELIGSSGSFDSLSEMIALNYYSIDIIKNKTEYQFDLEDFETLYHLVVKSTKSERLTMKGLISMRVDMIVVSCILLSYILKSISIHKMRSSTYSLKEGVLNQVITNRLK